MQTAEVYRKLRFTLRYLLGNLSDFEPRGDSVPVQQLPLLDRWEPSLPPPPPPPRPLAGFIADNAWAA